MARLSITTAWNEAAAFVKHEAGSLYLIAFGLIALPMILFQVVLPSLGPLPIAQPAASIEPALMAAYASTLLKAFLIFVPALLLNLWGFLTITILVLGEERVIGRAFGRAARRAVPVAGAHLLLFLGLFVAMMLLAAFFPRRSAGDIGSVILLASLLSLGVVAASARLMLIPAAAAVEPVGPIAMIRRSWQLTAGNFWKLLAFLLLSLIVITLIQYTALIVVGIPIALIAGAPAPGSLGMFALQLVYGAVRALTAMYFAATLARIYAQLAGDGAASTGQVFK